MYNSSYNGDGAVCSLRTTKNLSQLFEREGIQAIVDAGFLDTFRLFTKGNGHYSWWSHFANARARNVGWRIDYVFVSQMLKSKIRKAFLEPFQLGSDHCPVGIEVAL